MPATREVERGVRLSGGLRRRARSGDGSQWGKTVGSPARRVGRPDASRLKIFGLPATVRLFPTDPSDDGTRRSGVYLCHVSFAPSLPFLHKFFGGTPKSRR